MDIRVQVEGENPLGWPWVKSQFWHMALGNSFSPAFSFLLIKWEWYGVTHYRQEPALRKGRALLSKKLYSCKNYKDFSISQPSEVTRLKSLMAPLEFTVSRLLESIKQLSLYYVQGLPYYELLWIKVSSMLDEELAFLINNWNAFWSPAKTCCRIKDYSSINVVFLFTFS